MEPDETPLEIVDKDTLGCAPVTTINWEWSESNRVIEDESTEYDNTLDDDN